ncbi:MAG: 16S rRNA processing protein RimM [Deltaproteobacteria bacterium RIFOXYD12_FULL_50_9]|nr:MAG: 16S rRNA processing protein RimM [Deltaproteobacteria bacterium RIFOXYD12_FULL_50_9]
MKDQELSESYVAVATVIKAHGIRGEIKVQPYFGGLDEFNRYPDFLLVDPASGTSRLVQAGRFRAQNRLLLLELDWVTDRDAAEQCRGWELWVKKEYLPALPEGQWYRHELEGLRVVTIEGRDLGVVSDLIFSGAHEILVITGTGREYLIPLVSEFIVAKDDVSRTLTVSPAPGLLEINE